MENKHGFDYFFHKCPGTARFGIACLRGHVQDCTYKERPVLFTPAGAFALFGFGHFPDLSIQFFVWSFLESLADYVFRSAHCLKAFPR